MKVIAPKYKWIEDELEKLPLDQRIEKCGRLCYKSEDKITADSAPKFVRNIRDRGHNSVLEMATVTLVSFLPWENVARLLETQPKFLHISCSNPPYDGNTALIVTGSIRAFREQYLRCQEDGVSQDMVIALNEWPLFVEDIDHDLPIEADDGFSIDNPDGFGGDTFMKHKHVAIKFTVNRAVSHELVRHRPCSFLQECLSSDAVVRSFNGNKKWTMKELHRIFNQRNCGVARKQLRVRTKTQEGEIVPAKVKNVIKSGTKHLWEIKTRNGYQLKSSLDHIYFTEKGEKRLKDIMPGDRIWLNGIPLEHDWLKKEYRQKNRMRPEIAQELGIADSTLGKIIRRYGLQKPKKQYPNRQPGHGIKGMFSKEMRSRIAKRMIGPSNPGWLGDGVSAGGSRSRLHRQDSAAEHQCICGRQAQEMHHIDRNPHNNNQDNIEHCCIRCHRARHKDGAKWSWLDEVVSITYCGLGMTYDLEVDHPAHNFAANGFFVHNSQRYCRYGDDIVFINPWWLSDSSDEDFAAAQDWETIMEVCEESYHFLLSAGLSPQAARTVLPNSCKTEIIVYCNLQEWHHILRLRTGNGADPSMREVMIPLLREFQDRFPGMFDDLQPAE